MIEGGCLCGRVRYEIDGGFGQVTHCHCSMCRRVHGAAFGTYGAVPYAHFRWTEGESFVKTYRSSDVMERTFCAECGSTLQAHFAVQPDEVYLALGTVDGDPGCRAEAHIFTGSRAPWFDITDDLPQYETWTDQYGGA